MGSFAGIAPLVLSAVAVAILLRVCWTDFFDLKIWNRDLFALLLVTGLMLIIVWPWDILLRLGFGATLFCLGLIFWMLRWMGAGDVKLLGTVGCLVDSEHLFMFVLLNLIFATGMVVFLRKAETLRLIPHLAGRRAVELAAGGRVPFGIPIALSAIAVLVVSCASQF
jgi:prepilin peptidase CpaA